MTAQRRLFLLPLLLITPLLLAAACDEIGPSISGSGNLELRAFEEEDFTGVDISHAFEFEIEAGSSYQVLIEADDNLFEYIEVDKFGGNLRIRLRGVNLSFGGFTLRATIKMPELHALETSGAVHGTITGFATRDDFELEASGASSVSGDIEAIDVVLNLSGASVVELEGACERLDIDGSGASRIDLNDFPCQDATVTLEGASNADININRSIDHGNLSGASHLTYEGDPTIGQIDTSGASSIRSR